MQNRRRESPLVIFVKAFPPQIVGFMVLQIALINGVLMIGATFLGLFLDRQFGTRPLLTLVLPITGAILSILIAYLLGKRTIAKSRKAYLDWRAASGDPVVEPVASSSRPAAQPHPAGGIASIPDVR